MSGASELNAIESDWAARYTAGVGIGQLSKEAGISEKTMRNRLKKAGVYSFYGREQPRKDDWVAVVHWIDERPPTASPAASWDLVNTWMNAVNWAHGPAIKFFLLRPVQWRG